jgi:hypothetical protein
MGSLQGASGAKGEPNATAYLSELRRVCSSGDMVGARERPLCPQRLVLRRVRI